MEIRDFYKKHLEIKDEKLIEELCAESRFYNLKKDERFIWQGEIQQNVYFLIKGILRGYSLTAKGEEITEGFAFHYGEPIVPLCGFMVPSETSVSAVVDTLCIGVPVATVQRLGKIYPEVMELHTYMLARKYKRHHDNLSNLHTMDAQERYEWFLAHYPGLIDKVRHRDIASFIAVTPVSLSRIRHKISQQRENE